MKINWKKVWVNFDSRFAKAVISDRESWYWQRQQIKELVEAQLKDKKK